MSNEDDAGEDKRKKRVQPYSLQSFLIHGYPWSYRWDYEHHIVPPISSSTAFRLERAERAARGFQQFTDAVHHRRRYHPVYIYERLDEPTRAMLEENLARVEGGAYALTFASGMAAISAVLLTLLEAGDEIVAHHTLYGCTHSLLTHWLQRLGITVRFADFTQPDRVAEALSERTRVVYLETPTNPTLDILDLRHLARLVRQANRTRARRIYTVVDNTFATPFCQRPLEHGIDFVVESLTKNIGGFGTEMGGAVVTRRREFESDLFLCRKDFGGTLSAKSAWSILVYGLPTLPWRLRAQMRNARAIVNFLKRQPEVRLVRWPGDRSHPHYALARRQMRDPEGRFAPGNMIFFSMAGDPETARARAEVLIDTLARDAYSVTLAVSLGQIRTLIEHPASMTHASVPPEEQLEMGIDPGGLRMSVGLEHRDDILRDLEHAFQAVREQVAAAEVTD